MSEQRKTIYYVWNYVEWGGAQIYFLGLMRAARRKYRVKAVLPENSARKMLDYLDDNRIEYDFFKGQIDFSKNGSFAERLKRRWNDLKTNVVLAKKLSGDDLKNSIVQIDVVPWSGFFLLVYLSLKTDVFVTFHTALAPLSSVRRIVLQAKFAALNLFKNFHIVASNFDVKKSLRSWVSRENYERIEVIYSSINADEIENALKIGRTRDEIADKYKFPPDKIWVCCVAQFIERKGCWTFLEAIEILRAKRDDLFFFWLGTAPLADETKNLIAKYDLKNDFRFLSAAEIGATRSELLTLWQSAEIFCLPSLMEGLPVALIEAMALGNACVASNVNAIPEAVIPFETGILVEPGESEELAAAIEKLADDESLRANLGTNARQMVLEKFEEKITGGKMLELYERANG